MSVKHEICFSSGGQLKTIFEKTDENIFEKAEEIRVRAYKPLYIKLENNEIYINEKGCSTNSKNAFIPAQNDIQDMVTILCRYSRYAYREDFLNGFITIDGGHRVGLGGKMILKDGKTDNLTDINSLNIRVAHQKKGCGERLMKYIQRGLYIKNTIIVSPPGCGKTTLLRDVIRIASNSGINVSVIDERSEICAVCKGQAQNDVGERSDILDGCPKAEGMVMALRSLSPQVIACDEIGSDEDINAVKEAAVCGVSLLCSVHGFSVEDAVKRLKSSAEEFETYILLCRKNKKRCAVIFDKKGERQGEEWL